MDKITNTQFSKLIKQDKVTIIDFFAVWCGPCRMMHQVLEEAEKKYTNFNFAQIDIDQFTELAIKQNVMAVPTIVAYKSGKEVARSTGYCSQEEFFIFLNSVK